MERLFDPSAELVVHRLLFAAPIGRATQDHGLLGLGVARELDLDAFVDRAPAVRASEFRGELLQLRLRRADDVASASLAQPREIVGAGHAAVGDPDPSHHTMPGLHSGHDRLQGPRIVGIAGEHLVAQWKAVEGHDQRDAHLLAVWAMVAGIAALGLRVAFRLALKIGARDIVEQHLVLNCKQLSATLRQMCFEGGLVRKQMIKGAVQTVLVDLRVAELQQIAERRPTVPIRGNVQLARRLAEPGRHQNSRHLRPGDTFQAHWQQLPAQLLKASSAPECERQVHIAKLTRAFDANALQTYRHRQIFAAVFEQLRLLGSAYQLARQRLCLNTTAFIEFAKLRHCLLNDAPPDTNAANQAPITVNLAILPANRVAQIHAPSQLEPPQKKIPKVVTTGLNRPFATTNPLIRLTPVLVKSPKLTSSRASSARNAENHQRLHETPRWYRRRG